eukprot:TRINITY_DN6462_c0_g1_i1.p1 TRINITY_DN6462_c0_g1~~TRINITY_DN6462_c0_g1_i1.p1  ORF type:complete len:197 (+),score=23.72 TRINITY_DN6462_c0_g1_i1:38-592(+)
MLCDSRRTTPAWSGVESGPCGMRTPIRLVSKAEGLIEEMAKDQTLDSLETLGRDLVDIADSLGFKVTLCEAMPDPVTFFHGGVRWLTLIPKYGSKASYDAFYIIPDFASHWSVRSPTSQLKAALAESLQGSHFVGPASSLNSLLDVCESCVSASFSDLPPWRSASVWKTALAGANSRFVTVKEL